MTTENWTSTDYLNYVVNNKLDELWTSWFNPSGGGVRVAAYKPIYTDGYAKWLENGNKKCSKKNCDGNFVISDTDKENRILNRWRCNKCTTKKDILYRNTDKRDVYGRNQPKLHFSTSGQVRFYASKGRTFYGTLIIYDEEILNPDAIYADVKLMKSVTLGIDIDLKYGSITDKKNREELQKVIDYLKKELLDKIVPGSYNLQTSGNGVYILIHHRIVNKDVFRTCGLFNYLINDINKKIENEYVKIDALNGPSRVFKIIGSIHQQYDLVAIPLPYNVDLTKMSPDDFKIDNFDINNYIIEDDNGNKKFNFYKRFNESDSITLYDYLNKNVAFLPSSTPRAMKATVRTSDMDESTWMENCKKFMIKEQWIPLNIDIPGEVYYRIKDNKLETNYFRVPHEDRENIKKLIRQNTVKLLELTNQPQTNQTNNHTSKR